MKRQRCRLCKKIRTECALEGGTEMLEFPAVCIMLTIHKSGFLCNQCYEALFDELLEGIRLEMNNTFHQKEKQ